jgi:hypothetical protein
MKEIIEQNSLLLEIWKNETNNLKLLNLDSVQNELLLLVKETT